MREINEMFEFQDNFKLNNLIKLLSLQIGNIANFSDLASQSGFNVNDMKKIMYILEKTYICNTLKPYFTNKRKEITKSPKIFFFDLGFRNVVIENFEINKFQDIGAMYENFIYGELSRKQCKFNYWRTKSKAEVDFIVEKNQELIAIEIKTNVKNDIIGKGYLSFLQNYNPVKSYILSKSFENSRNIDDFKIEFLPFAKFIIM